MRLALTILMVCFAIISTFAQTDEKAELAKLNDEVITKFKAGKLKASVELAQQALDTSLRIYGDKDARTADAYATLGIIQGQLGKDSDAKSSLARSVEIYEKLNSKQSFEVMLSLANIYALSKDFKNADEYYLKSSTVAAKNFGVESEQFQKIDSLRVCAGWDASMLADRDKAFYEKRNALLGDLVKFDLGIVNRNAKYLPKPIYPIEARGQRAGGVVPVKVKIDESGKVSDVKVVCGPPSLAQSTADAVKDAKFQPFVVDGKPSIVHAIVVYRYIP